MKITENELRLIKDTALGTTSIYRLNGDALEPLYICPRLHEYHGMTSDEYDSITKDDAFNIVLPEDRKRLKADIKEICINHQELNCFYRIFHKAEEFDWVHIIAKVCGEMNGHPIIISTFTNASTESNAYKSIIDRSKDIIFVCDYSNYEMLYLNEAAKHAANKDSALRKTCYNYFKGTDAPCADCLHDDIRSDIISKERYDSVNDRWQLVAGERINWYDHDAMARYTHDITDTKAKELHQKMLSELDSLTALYNRRTALKMIKEYLNTNSQERCALFEIDLDNLKIINDTMGHSAGDEALKFLATTMKNHFRNTDVTARIGGDEFIAFLTEIEDTTTLRNSMLSFCKKISGHKLSKSKSYDLSCSIGCSFGIAGQDDYETMFRQADLALYNVENNGKNDFAIFIPEMEESGYHYAPHEGITITRTEWFSDIEYMKLIQALATLYPLVISANLSKNTYYMMEYAKHTTQESPDIGEYDQLIESVSQTFHPDERRSFIDFLSRGNLIKAYNEGKLSVSHEGRQLGDDNIYRWLETIIVFIKDHDDICEITFTRPIDEKKKNEEEVHKLQKLLQLTVASSFEYICLLDTKKRKYELYSNDGLNTHTVPEIGEFDKVTAEIRDKHVLPEERDEYYNNAIIETVIRRMAETDGHYKYNYSLYDGKREAAFYYYEQTHDKLLMTVRRI